MPATAARSRVREVVPDPGPELSNTCGAQVEAWNRIADAIGVLASSNESVAASHNAVAESNKEVAGAVKDLKPAADAVHGFFTSLDGFTKFVRDHRMKLTGALIAAAVSIGAITPNAGHQLAVVLKSLGAS